MFFPSHKTILGLCIPLLFFFLALYIWQINAVMTTRAFYDVSFKKFQELGVRNQELEILFSRTDTLGSVEGQLKKLFEPVAHVTYLRILEGAVARSYGEVPPP